MEKRVHTPESIAQIAAKFRTRKEFERGDNGAWQAARYRGIMDDVCSHMERQLRSLSDEEIAKIASKFKTRKKFAVQDTSAYQAALKRGIIDEVCAHMEVVYRNLSDAEVASVASCFKTRYDFQMGDEGAYTTARKRGILDDVCSHMESRIGGFDPEKSGRVYQIEFTLPSRRKVWKVGITNLSVKRRVRGMGVSKTVQYTITHDLWYEDGYRVRDMEKFLHSCGVRYRGEPFLHDGNTEVFVNPLLR